MPRPPRLDMAGFHHIVNRGVNRTKIYKEDADKEKFLEILCKACRVYKVNVHDYSLMDNHYHLLLETTRENLSLFMRQVNANYAIFFNKKYKRTGHLWQGRYKSWFIVKEEYLYTLFRYIEHNPIKAKMAWKIGDYPYTLLASVLNKSQKIIPCAEHSKLKKEYRYRAIQELLERPLSYEEHKEMEAERKKKIEAVEHTWKQEKEKTLEEHFGNYRNKEERNTAIMAAIEDGYKLADIGRYLGLSASAIGKVRDKYKKSVFSSPDPKRGLDAENR